MVRRSFAAASFIVVAALSAACSDDEPTTATPGTDAGTGSDSSPNPPPVQQKDIVDTAVAANDFKTLVAATQAAGLESTLRGAGPYTVFAPTDAAFAKVPSFLTEKLLTAPYKTELGLILKYHVLAGSVKAADILGKQSEPATVLGAKLFIDGTGGKVVINKSVNVVSPDVLASNGVIHAIDGVLLPTIVDTAVGYDDGTNTFKTLVAALNIAGVENVFTGPPPYTVFAPTDKAFADIPKADLDAVLANKTLLTTILKYHVVSGAVYAKDVMAGTVTTLSGPVNVTVTGSNVELGVGTQPKSKVVLTDLPASNGVVHVIDKVILPPS